MKAKLKRFFGSLWRTLYVKPKDWLCNLQTDKVLHFIVSMILVQQFFFLTSNVYVASLVAFAIGVFKEVVIDKLIMKGRIDVGDLFADAFGVCAGLLLFCVDCALIKIHEWLW